MTHLAFGIVSTKATSDEMSHSSVQKERCTGTIFLMPQGWDLDFVACLIYFSTQIEKQKILQEWWCHFLWEDSIFSSNLITSETHLDQTGTENIVLFFFHFWLLRFSWEEIPPTEICPLHRDSFWQSEGSGCLSVTHLHTWSYWWVEVQVLQYLPPRAVWAGHWSGTLCLAPGARPCR